MNDRQFTIVGVVLLLIAIVAIGTGFNIVTHYCVGDIQCP